MGSNLPPLPPAPGWAQRFRSDDLDEVRAFLARFAGEHSRVVHGTGPLGFEQSWVAGSAAVAGWVGTRLDNTLRGALLEPALHVSVPAGSTYRMGRRAQVAGPESATFVAPGWEYTLDRVRGPGFVVAVEGNRLAEEIRARSMSGGEPVLRSRLIRLDESARARLIVAATEFVRATAPAAVPGEVPRAEARLIDVVVGLLLGDEVVGRGQAVSAARIAELESWIEAHLQEPITVGRLCAVAGIGERMLQKAFQSRRGMSPMRFVTERRLAAAHRRLMNARPGDDVTTVAVRLGFGHTGRFASLYRHAFGESPSQSLRRLR